MRPFRVRSLGRFSAFLGCALAGVPAFTPTAHAGFHLQGYGFLLPNAVLSSQGLESFSQPNSSAYTAALNPAFRKSQADSMLTWQVAQSRMGIKILEEEGAAASPGAQTSDTHASGALEFDFIDFSRSSPTTTSLPRLRRAYVHLKTDSGWDFQLGQDWDLISPLAPFTYNFVGHYFEGGDIAFMRIQAMAILSHGHWESGFALGMPNQNSTSSATGIENGKWPTLAWRETFTGLADHKFGFSVLAAAIEPAASDPARILGGAFTLFAEGKEGSTQWVTEAYVGQNTANLGMQGLSFGDRNRPRMREAGAYVSARTQVGTASRIFGGLGGAWMLNPAEMLPSYTRSGGVAVLNSPFTGPGLERNVTARIGLDHEIKSGLLGFAELAYLASTHHLLNTDTGLVPHQTAWVLNSGLVLNF